MSLKIGLIAASRIATGAIVEPAVAVDGVALVGVAARDPDRARRAADQWGIERAYGSYEELIDSPDVDAVYIATPPSLHRPWAVAAIEAGKHVLCEKPFAANAEDAQRIADAARARPEVVVMEAFHWRYHPYVHQMRRVLDSGVLGELRRIETVFDVPDGAIERDDIRWNLAIGGGATMDLGCYSIQWARFAGGPDFEVVSAEAVCPVAGVDGSLEAEVRWPSGLTGSIASSMIADAQDVESRLVVRGELGTMTVTHMIDPHFGGRVVVETGSGHDDQAVAATTTYMHQLVAFRDAINRDIPFPTTADEGVRNMELVDACYRAAGLAPRPVVDV